MVWFTATPTLRSCVHSTRRRETGGSGDLLSMATGLFNAQKGSQDNGSGAQQGAQVNAQNMFAFLQAQLLQS